MNEYDNFIIAGMAATAAFIPLGIMYSLDTSVLVLRGRRALTEIRMGNNPRNYRDLFSDIRADGIAKYLMPKKRELLRVVREGRKTRESLSELE